MKSPSDDGKWRPAIGVPTARTYDTIGPLKWIPRTAGFGNDVEIGDTMWFSSKFNVQGTVTYPFTFFVTESTIEITGNDMQSPAPQSLGSPLTIAVPDATITVIPSQGKTFCGTTTFTNGSWVTTVENGLSGRDFLTAVAYVPPNGMSSGNVSVKWSVKLSFPQSAGVQWQWAIATFNPFAAPADYSLLVVSPTDDTCFAGKAGEATNQGQATKGGSGGGGSNLTGSHSSTQSASCVC